MDFSELGSQVCFSQDPMSFVHCIRLTMTCAMGHGLPMKAMKFLDFIIHLGEPRKEQGRYLMIGLSEKDLDITGNINGY